MGAAVKGYVAPGFGAVADAFAANFAERGESGAACSVMVEGKTVVDIHGGEARPGRPWNEQTRSVVFSTSKGVTTILLLMAAERGLLDLDEPVATYWPEFGAHGKDRITVRQTLAHRAGLIAPEIEHTPQDLKAWLPVVDGLAAQAPLWKPNAAHAYHPLTFGYLAGEVLRRVSGKLPSQWLAEEVAGPLGLSTTFGADPADEDLAVIRRTTGVGDGVPLTVEARQLSERAAMTSAYGPDLFEASNGEVYLGTESPGANLVTRARDLARLYSATVTEVDGIRLTGADVIAEASKPLSSGTPFLGPDAGHIWATGFMVHSPRRGMVGPGSFGHDGAGGQLAFAHPGLRLGFGFQTAQAGGDDDLRAEILSAALLSCL
ncbi:serine hydrolase domain-containing protein [Streptomyces ipomoeae]|uniref:serine hydrolase domain-containing protein n=1 Tax=Streptomyces ipomoeae TaxID=103232 RepID=UPI001146C11B|nr:serine hydrolase domain-containing protein [Streptomyces ipomoeae]MDX2939552.1 serine hydrolase [Streptomyces ipomoeae]TQE31019.1 class A beta-lactamase-related serine hydrolase [Streptomyces ipomoeae]